MKRILLFSILMLLLCISCFSCDKEKNEERKYRRGLNGDWEWEQSTSPSKNGESSTPLITYSPFTTGNNYGLRIKNNDAVFLYENGKQIKKGKLTGIEKVWDVPEQAYYKYVTFELDGKTIVFVDKPNAPSPGSITIASWPYDANYSNQFKKIK